MRAGELAALRISGLNLLAGTVDVSESMMEVGGQLIAGPTKTGRPRTLTLPRFLAEMLGEHLGRYPSSDGYVFTMAEGGPIRQRNFYRRHCNRLSPTRASPPGCISTACGTRALRS